MSKRSSARRAVSPAARVFSELQADEALLPGEASALRRSGAVFLVLMALAAAPLFWAANAAGLIGDVPTAVAHSSSSGPGEEEDDDDVGTAGDGDDDESVTANTDDTSANGNSTRGTTADNDTVTKLGTDDTSGQGETRGTTADNDTHTKGATVHTGDV